MSHARRLRLPSVGFGVLCLSWIALGLFLGWGAREPLLSQIWTLQQRMDRHDFSGLRPDEVELLRKGLARHPDLGRAFAGRSAIGLVEPADDEDWSAPLERLHLVVVPASAKTPDSEIECDIENGSRATTVHLTGRGLTQVLECPPGKAPQRVALALPGGSPPVLVTARAQPPAAFRLRLGTVPGAKK